MNAIELRGKAVEAAYNYRKVYGKFPEKIGIHYMRRYEFPRSLFFPDPPLEEMQVRLTQDMTPLGNIVINRHEAQFAPVAGLHIQWDEAYFPLPGNEQRMISSRFIAMLAREFES